MIFEEDEHCASFFKNYLPLMLASIYELTIHHDVLYAFSYKEEIPAAADANRCFLSYFTINDTFALT